VTPRFEELLRQLKKLPGLGHRSAERIALHLLVEKPETLDELVQTMQDTGSSVRSCITCGNLTESEICTICADSEREKSRICLVERVPDLFAIERSGAYRGLYHVLQGKLSPIRGIGPDSLNLSGLAFRLDKEEVKEVILAIANDLEGEATCHYIVDQIIGDRELLVSRIGFGIPSGAGVTFADETTLRSALEARRGFS
jgi:recombination protein RecR